MACHQLHSKGYAHKTGYVWPCAYRKPTCLAAKTRNQSHNAMCLLYDGKKDVVVV